MIGYSDSLNDRKKMKKSLARKCLAALNRGINILLSPLDMRLVGANVTRAYSHPNFPGIRHIKVHTAATYAPWLTDVAFQRRYEMVGHHTMVDLYRCYELWLLGKQLQTVEGDYLEVGVWRGGTGCIIAASAPTKTVYLADTFTGVVKAGDGDTYYVGGEHSDTSVEIVRRLADKLSLDNVRVLKGIFPDETGHDAPSKIALLHCDVDVYSSAIDIVQWAIPRLSKGGVIVFDDYGFRACEGITKMVNELRNDKRFLFVHNLNGHAILIHQT
jgi:O-methyltransferase